MLVAAGLVHVSDVAIPAPGGASESFRVAPGGLVVQLHVLLELMAFRAQHGTTYLPLRAGLALDGARAFVRRAEHEIAAETRGDPLALLAAQVMEDLTFELKWLLTKHFRQTPRDVYDAFTVHLKGQLDTCLGCVKPSDGVVSTDVFNQLENDVERALQAHSSCSSGSSSGGSAMDRAAEEKPQGTPPDASNAGAGASGTGPGPSPGPGPGGEFKRARR